MPELPRYLRADSLDGVLRVEGLGVRIGDGLGTTPTGIVVEVLDGTCLSHILCTHTERGFLPDFECYPPTPTTWGVVKCLLCGISVSESTLWEQARAWGLRVIAPNPDQRAYVPYGPE